MDAVTQSKATLASQRRSPVVVRSIHMPPV